jgi:hypothetical protein
MGCLININDARSYVLPISNIIGKRLNRITTLNNKLTMMVAKLYSIPDENDKNEICNDISKIISEIELLVLKNIDDTQILEYSLSEFTIKSSTLPKNMKKTESPTSDQHIYA